MAAKKKTTTTKTATKQPAKKPASKAVAKKAVAKKAVAKKAVAKKSAPKPAAKKPAAMPMPKGNQVVHWEIQSKMPSELHDFYRDVFAWTIDANNAMNYGMVASGGKGGING